MKRMLMVVAGAVMLSSLTACTNKGAQWADKINEKMVARLKEGKIKSEVDLAWAKVEVMQETMKELKLDKITEHEKKTFDEKMAKYEAEWKAMLPKG